MKLPSKRTRIAIAGALCLLTAGAVSFTLFAGGDRTPEKRMVTDKARSICREVLDDVRRALFVYRVEKTWSWNDILAFNMTLDSEPGRAIAEFQEIRQELQAPPKTMEETLDVHPWLKMQDREREIKLSGRIFAPVPSDKDRLFGQLRPHGQGAYRVVLGNNPEDPDPALDTDGRLIVFITGIAPDAATFSVLEAELEFLGELYTPEGAIHAHGGSLLEGTTKLEGSHGTAAIDGRLHIFGSVGIEQSLPPDVGPVPDVQPADYRHLADHILTRGGDGAPNSKNFTWNRREGWTVQPGPDLPAATYFVEDDLRILTGTGEAEATFLVSGSVDIRGGARLRAHQSGTLILAAGDLQINGTSKTHLAGFIAVREQARVGGSPTLEGALLVRNHENLHLFLSPRLIKATWIGLQVGGSTRILCNAPSPTLLRAPLHSLRLVRVSERP